MGRRVLFTLPVLEFQLARFHMAVLSRGFWRVDLSSEPHPLSQCVLLDKGRMNDTLSEYLGSLTARLADPLLVRPRSCRVIRARGGEGLWTSGIRTWLVGVRMVYRSSRGPDHIGLPPWVTNLLATRLPTLRPSSYMRLRARSHLHAPQSAAQQPQRVIPGPGWSTLTKKQSLSLGTCNSGPRRRLWRLSLAIRKYVGTGGI